MTTEDSFDAINSSIDWIYSQIADRPHMFSGRTVCIEAYILAVEGLLDRLFDKQERTGKYSDFLGAKEFGAHFFSTLFERSNSCRLRLVPDDIDEELAAECGELESQFNAQRAGLAERAEQWRWSSLWRRVTGSPEARQLLHRWPLPEPADWLAHVNRPQTEAELKAVRHSLLRGTPFGSPQWQSRTVQRLGLEWTLRARGRPRKPQEN